MIQNKTGEAGHRTGSSTTDLGETASSQCTNQALSLANQEQWLLAANQVPNQ